jgi:predicted component of type VI protein secretion system
MAQTFQLVVRAGPNPGKTYELTQELVTIGRDTANPIVINDPEISRKHAQLKAQSGSYIIEDLGSTNGTFVNGQRLMGPHMLRHGEVIMLGEKVSLVYEAVGFEPEATLVGAAGPQAVPPASRETYRVPPEEAYPPTPVHTEVVPPPPAYQPPVYGGQAPPAYAPPAYSGQVPPGPAAYAPPEEPYAEAYEAAPEEAPKKSRKWIYVGCGCLVVMLCCLVGAAFAFDYLNMYCEPPFNLIFSCP